MQLLWNYSFQMTARITLGTLIPAEKQKIHTRLLIRIVDKVMGLAQMDRLYQQHQMQGLEKADFADKLLQILDITIAGEQELLAKIPKTGPLVLASNHPFGGLEGVVLARLLSKVRPDLKVLVNFALQIFPELSDYFIFTNPLAEGDPRNGPSLRTTMAHVKEGGALLLFPSGKVSYRDREQQRVVEHPWNRLVARLVKKNGARFMPIWVEGQNSDMFYRVETVYYPLRMLFLGRELLNKQGHQITLCSGNAIKSNDFAREQLLDEQAEVGRCLSIACSDSWKESWPATNSRQFMPLAEEIPGEQLLTEIAALPKEQHLLSYKQFDVYYGFQSQMPLVVQEIARLRELVFRQHDEGSGQSRDTDKFDATYTQLFIIHREEGRIIGAYRMGQTDELLQLGEKSPLYLSQMFNFDSQFFNQTEPCLEMGRSFLIPEYQKSYYGLYLLWRGITAFACKFPRYRRLYGTVSISKLYDKRSIALMEQALVKAIPGVSAKVPWSKPLSPELQTFAKNFDLNKHLSTFLKTLEADGKDIPVLVKHYQKLGAEFYCLGLDGNFAQTPGLLLCVDLAKIPHKSAKQYFGDGLQDYLQYHQIRGEENTESCSEGSGKAD